MTQTIINVLAVKKKKTAHILWIFAEYDSFLYLKERERERLSYSS